MVMALANIVLESGYFEARPHDPCHATFGRR